MTSRHMQIGEVAELTALSLRTIRYYEEVGLVTPSARSHGGFRLYTDTEVNRLQLIKRMKPLDFSLDEMRDLLAVLDRLEARDATAAEREQLLGRLDMYVLAVDERRSSLRSQLELADTFAGELRHEVQRQGRAQERR